jgi:hypothetical protein
MSANNNNIMSVPVVNISETEKLLLDLTAQLTVQKVELETLNEVTKKIQQEYDSIWSEDLAKAYGIEFKIRTEEEKKPLYLEVYTKLRLSEGPVYEKEQEISQLEGLITYHTRLVAIASNPESLVVFDQDGFNWLGFNKYGLTKDGRHQSTFGEDGYAIYDHNKVDAFNFDIYGYH